MGPTDGTWGMGATCAAAESDLRDHIIALARDLCTSMEGLYCSTGPTVFTGTCWWNGTQYQADGYGNPVNCRLPVL
ncbi:MAG: hypothetical protein ABIS20_15935 [Thermoanaerobaculia bacterium]